MYHSTSYYPASPIILFVLYVLGGLGIYKTGVAIYLHETVVFQKELKVIVQQRGSIEMKL